MRITGNKIVLATGKINIFHKLMQIVNRIFNLRDCFKNLISSLIDNNLITIFKFLFFNKAPILLKLSQ